MDKSVDWGPKYWYVLHMMAFHYPLSPNKVTKKKYYDTIMNLPLFLPHQEMGDKFSRLLDKYPLTPYLDSRESLIKWTHFIHNRVNEQLEKPTFPYSEFIHMYKTPKNKKDKRSFLEKNNNIIIIGVLIIIITAVYRLL